MDNDGIKRGDRADTGDLEARPTEGVSEAGSGVQGGGSDTGHPTANPSALGDSRTLGEGTLSGTLEAAEGADDSGGEIGDLTIVDATDPNLGLTNVGDVPPDDWAADTGPTRTAEAESHGVSRDLADEDVSEDGRRIDFEHGRRR
jgi:hypothetical protein